MESAKKIIFFDGVCNLCNNWVQYIIRKDRHDQFQFAPLQGVAGQRFLQERQIVNGEMDSVILYEPGKAYYTKSAAALKIGQAFGGGWKLLGLFEWVPGPIRDFFYDIVARNRYKWFGKQTACMVPTPELQAKFLS